MATSFTATTLSLHHTPSVPNRTSLSTKTSSPLSSSHSSFFTNTFKPLTLAQGNTSNRKRSGFSCNCLFGLGVPELVVIAGVVALVFGPKKLPEVGRSIGKTVKSFQQVGYHPDFESSRCLFIVRKDGEMVDFSYWKCIKGLIRKNYPLYADNFILRHFRRRRHND